MARKIIWVATESFRGYGCSECGWVFTASGPLVGDTIDELKQQYESQRDSEFAAHPCVDHPRKTGAKPR
jgi:hypothetical protein